MAPRSPVKHSTTEPLRSLVRPKTISVLLVMGLKILDIFRVGTHVFFLLFFLLEKNIILCIWKGISPFKVHKIICFSPKKPWKNSMLHQ